MSRRRHQFGILLGLAALLIACLAACRAAEPTTGPPTALPIPTTSAASAAASTEPSGPTATGTPLPPSATPSRTPTTYLTRTTVPSDTPTPPPGVFAVVIRDFAGVYTGPAAVFDTILTLTAGMAVDLTGRDAAGGWFYADLLLGQGGWVPIGSVRIEGEVGNLPVLDSPTAPAATPTSSAVPAIAVRDLDTLVLTGFKLHENVVLTVVQIEVPATAQSRNCVITDPDETICLLFNLNRVGVAYRITAQGDQGSFAEILFVREE